MAQETVLGILGGLGPMATAYFYELLTAHTKVARDQDHIDLIISSKASTPDRTAFILGQSSEDPFAVMESEAHKLVKAGAGVLAIPCNTAHYFYDRLAATLPVPLIHMVEDTVERAQLLGGRKVGILATDGTVCTETYQRACKAKGLACAVPDAASQKTVMRIIYEDIKRGNPPDMDSFHAVSDALFAQGCDYLLLGCTELSLVKKTGALGCRFIDSMEVLAERAILACGKTPQGFVWQ